MESQDNSRPITIFVLGLLSVVTCQILGPVAIVMGNAYMRECQALDVEPDGMATAGRIMGIIGTIFLVLSLILVLLYVGLFAAIIAFEP